MLKLKKKLRMYLIAAVVGTLVGALMYYVQPVKWKGQALVGIGHIFQDATQTVSTLESLPTVGERLKARSFIQAVAERAKNDEIVALLSVEEGAGLTLKPTRNADSLIITVEGGSVELVTSAINAVVAELLLRHDVILNEYRSDTLKELARLEIEMDNLAKRLAKILEDQLPTDHKQIAPPPSTGFAVLAIQHDLDDRAGRSSDLRESISSSKLQPTSLLEPLSVMSRRMFSSMWRACLFGALLGVALCPILGQWGKLREILFEVEH